MRQKDNKKGRELHSAKNSIVYIHMYIRVDTKFRDTKFREISHQELISYFAKFSVCFAKFRDISRPSFAKFREIKMEIVSEISRN